MSAALAYGWHDVTTDQYLSVASSDHLTADFAANNIGGRIEGGYRFVIPARWMPNIGVTPYGALQAQAFYMPSYSENATSVFARSYDARTTTATRTELGAWFDQARPFDTGATLILRGRAAWARDNVSDPRTNAAFLSLPGSEFTVIGAALPRDLLLTTAGAEMRFVNGFSVGAQFDGEFAAHTAKYGDTGRLRYSW